MSKRTEHMEDFSGSAWACQLLSSPNLTRINMDSQRYGGPTGPHENSFLAKTIATPSTLRACVPLQSKSEVLVLLSFGRDLSSHSSLLAGGIICALQDEVMGLAACRVFERNHIDTFFTIELNVQYRRPVPAPGIALARASVEKVDGRRLWVKGSIEDGQGHVYANGRATFMKAKMDRL